LIEDVLSATGAILRHESGAASLSVASVRRFRRSLRQQQGSRGAPEVGIAWLALFFAGLLEIGWALGLKFSDGFTRFWPSVATVVAIMLSFGLITISLKSLPFGTVYALWTGIGAAGSMVVGILVFGESADAFRVMCLGLIIAGVVGLKLATP
jgi:quaternary ammonium compound-resistance protein SugE